MTEVDVLPAQSGASLLDKITNFADETGSQSKTQTVITASENKVFKSFVEQFATGERTGPVIDHDLATLVNDLLTEKLTKEKLEPVQDKSLKPENRENLVAPKINKPIWQQLKQSLSLSLLYAVLQVCHNLSSLQNAQDNDNPRANSAKRRSGRKPGARVTNSARLFTPGEKDSIADSKVGVIH